MSTTTTTTTQSTIQSPMGTLLLTVVDAEASTVAQSAPVATSQKPTPVESNKPSPTRGVKRQAAPAPKASISKATLFEHQLKTDQNGALAPDCKSVFLLNYYFLYYSELKIPFSFKLLELHSRTRQMLANG